MTADQTHQNKINLANIVILLSVVYFIAQVIFFALTIRPGLPPDEAFHIRHSIVFFSFPGIMPPLDQLDAWHGTDSRTFFLYHLLLGKLIHIAAAFELPAVYFLRSVNILFAAGYILIFYKLARLLLKTDMQVALAMFVHANILMFSFISGAVNHDNLVNLISIASIYYFSKTIVENDPVSFSLLLLMLGIGTLTKQAFLPLGLLMFLLAFWFLIRRFSLKEIVFSYSVQKPVQKYLVMSLVLLVALLNLFQHGNSILKYGSLDPSCATVYSVEQCRKEHVVFSKYDQLNLTADQRMMKLDPVRYFVIWSDYMLEKAMGIFAYSSYYQGKLFLGVTEVLLVVAIMLGWRNNIFTASPANSYASLIVITYVLILCFYVGYSSFQARGLLPRFSFAGVQGRYIFPVLSLIILLLTNFLTSIKDKRINVVLSIFVVIWLGYHGFVSFLLEGANLTPNNQLQNHHIEEVMHSQRFKYP